MVKTTNIADDIRTSTLAAVKDLYSADIDLSKINVSATRKGMDGDYTIVTFPLTKVAGKKPEEVGADLGAKLVAASPHISGYNVIKGFLNLTVDDAYWISSLQEMASDANFGQNEKKEDTVVVEFSSPNTNKPLHLGHIRNILLGWSVSRILEADGYDVKKVQIVNDRGIAICRSMLAWQKFGDGETPESSGMKGDHFVGKYYVKFASEFKMEYEAWQSTAEADQAFEERTIKYKEMDKATFLKEFKNDYFNEHSALGAEAKAMLIGWEAGDLDIRALWSKMNGWVLAGFDQTYETLGVNFTKLYFESDTYLLGKDMIAEGLLTKILTQDKKRVTIDLENIGLAIKTIIKSDGTSTYTSQDLGTAQLRWDDFGAKKMIYVVGDEQIAHFQGVFEILKRLGVPYAEGLYHLAYGMVDLPTGRMKSREGTVVDADDLVEEVKSIARKNLTERGELEVLSAEEKEEIVHRIALGALKYYILKVNPTRRMVFNPEESLDMQGDTGPYIQNAYVRIQSILRKANPDGEVLTYNYPTLAPVEKDLVMMLTSFPKVISYAAANYDPSEIASFNYNLGKTFHKFYHDMSIMKAESEDAKNFRIMLATTVGQVLAKGMDLIGIEMPSRM